MMRAKSLFVCVLFGACGGKQSTPPPTPPVADPTPDVKPDPMKPDPDVKPDPKPDPVAPATPAAHDPEWFAPAWKQVGVGQTISFGVEAIDQDLDETGVIAKKLPKSAKFDAYTQTITWTPTKAEIGKAEFEVEIVQAAQTYPRAFSIEVTAQKQPAPVAEELSPVIETLLMIRQPKRLEQVTKDWPLDKLLLTAANGFRWQFRDDNRAKLDNKPLDKKALYNQFLTQLSITHANPRLDPKSPKFDKKAFGDPKGWKVVAFRPRIDRQWTELRVVYRAVNAAEPVFAMWRLRPVVEYVPALPRPEEEHVANNKIFLGMVAKHLMADGGPNPKFMTDHAAHGKAVSALMTELMAFDDSKTKPYLRGFAIGIAVEARMGGGSAKNPDGTYKSGDGWGWSAMKPFQTQDAKTQAYVNVTIPGFWTKTIPSADNSTWTPTCSPRFTKGDPHAAPGYELLCRPTLGFVDLPDTTPEGKITNSRIDAVNRFIEHKQKYMTEDNFPLDDGRRDVGEENGMTCAQCHIRNFGMHDYSDLANTDPKKGVPKTRNKKVKTLNFVIIPETHWEEFTLEFLKHQECRAKENFQKFLPDQGKALTCPFVK